jgi:tetraacyldisaccharide 4'-kinase
VATDERVSAVNAALASIAPRVPRSTLHLEAGALVAVRPRAGDAVERPRGDIAGRAVRVITAIGDSRSFVRQLEELGARVEADVYPDHHHFTTAEIDRFVHSLPADGLAICTLKDAVKLADRWPREAPTLWYVSQRVSVERGVGGVEHILDELTRTRASRAR